MSRDDNPKFIERLKAAHIMPDDDLAVLTVKYADSAFRLLNYLVQAGVVPKEQLGRLWGDSLGVAHVDLEKTLFERAVVRQLPETLARELNSIALYEFSGGVTVAMADPADKDALNRIENAIGKFVSPVFAFAEDIAFATDVEYQTDDALLRHLDMALARTLQVSAYGQIKAAQLYNLAGDESIVQLTRGLILMAMREKASDIHIEPTSQEVRVRFRVDGILQEKMVLERQLHAPILTRLKIMARLDISETRKPLDGRITMGMGRDSVDLRFSSIPTIYGEKIVLRVLGRGGFRSVPNLQELGFPARVRAYLMKIMRSPNGVFFVTGPTGSGKTTTLYSLLKEINKPGINITTVEDPVEYRLDGLNQVQVNTTVGLDFATALRAFLRQDPNVILIGEVRDVETAKIASQAALTGHFVMATMHTNNSLQAVTRLIEMGVEPFLVAPSIIAVMSQRLVRKICGHCKEKYRVSDEQVSALFEWDGKTEVWFHRGKGCPQCNNTGYQGRVSIHELFILTKGIRSELAANASVLQVEKLAYESGFKPLRYDGLKKVLQGTTTIEEVDRVTVKEDSV